MPAKLQTRLFDLMKEHFSEKNQGLIPQIQEIFEIYTQFDFLLYPLGNFGDFISAMGTQRDTDMIEAVVGDVSFRDNSQQRYQALKEADFVISACVKEGLAEHKIEELGYDMLMFLILKSTEMFPQFLDQVLAPIEIKANDIMTSSEFHLFPLTPDNLTYIMNRPGDQKVTTKLLLAEYIPEAMEKTEARRFLEYAANEGLFVAASNDIFLVPRVFQADEFYQLKPLELLFVAEQYYGMAIASVELVVQAADIYEREETPA